MTDAVLYSVDAGIGTVRLNRPSAYNAVNGELIAGMLAAAAAIRSDSRVRAVVLVGEGRGFCSGLDMAHFGEMASGELSGDSASAAYEELSEAGANRVQQLGWQWQELEVPVIAALHGALLALRARTYVQVHEQPNAGVLLSINVELSVVYLFDTGSHGCLLVPDVGQVADLVVTKHRPVLTRVSLHA